MRKNEPIWYELLRKQAEMDCDAEAKKAFSRNEMGKPILAPIAEVFWLRFGLIEQGKLTQEDDELLKTALTREIVPGIMRGSGQDHYWKISSFNWP